MGTEMRATRTITSEYSCPSCGKILWNPEGRGPTYCATPDCPNRGVDVNRPAPKKAEQILRELIFSGDYEQAEDDARTLLNMPHPIFTHTKTYGPLGVAGYSGTPDNSYLEFEFRGGWLHGAVKHNHLVRLHADLGEYLGGIA